VLTFGRAVVFFHGAWKAAIEPQHLSTVVQSYAHCLLLLAAAAAAAVAAAG